MGSPVVVRIPVKKWPTDALLRVALFVLVLEYSLLQPHGDFSGGGIHPLHPGPSSGVCQANEDDDGDNLVAAGQRVQKLGLGRVTLAVGILRDKLLERHAIDDPHADGAEEGAVNQVDGERVLAEPHQPAVG